MSGTLIHNVIHTKMNGKELNAAHMHTLHLSLHYGVTGVKISQWFVGYSFLKVCCRSFGIFPLVAKGPTFVNLQLAANKLINGNCLLPERDILSVGKWTKCNNWPTFLKCRSQLAVARPQENAGCSWTLSLPQDHIYANVFTSCCCCFLRNDFILDIIA